MDADRSRGFILRPGEGRAIDLGGFQMTVKATSEETGGAFSLLEGSRLHNSWNGKNGKKARS